MKWFLYAVAFVLICMPALVFEEYGEFVSLFSIFFASICTMVAIYPSEEKKTPETGNGIWLLRKDSDKILGYFIFGIPVAIFFGFVNSGISMGAVKSYAVLGAKNGLLFFLTTMIFAWVTHKYRLKVDRDWQLTMTICALMLILAHIGTFRGITVIALLLASIFSCLPIASSKPGSKQILFAVFEASLFISVRIHPTLSYDTFWGIFTLVLGTILAIIFSGIFGVFENWFGGDDDCDCRLWAAEKIPEEGEEIGTDTPLKE